MCLTSVGEHVNNYGYPVSGNQNMGKTEEDRNQNDLTGQRGQVEDETENVKTQSFPLFRYLGVACLPLPYERQYMASLVVLRCCSSFDKGRCGKHTVSAII